MSKQLIEKAEKLVAEYLDMPLHLCRERPEIRLAELAMQETARRCAEIAKKGVDVPHPTIKGHIMKKFSRDKNIAKAIESEYGLRD